MSREYAEWLLLAVWHSIGLRAIKNIEGLCDWCKHQNTEHLDSKLLCKKCIWYWQEAAKIGLIINKTKTKFWIGPNEDCGGSFSYHSKFMMTKNPGGLQSYEFEDQNFEGSPLKGLTFLHYTNSSLMHFFGCETYYKEYHLEALRWGQCSIT